VRKALIPIPLVAGLILGLAILALALAAVGRGNRLPGRPPIGPERIAFRSDASGMSEIYTIGLDGTRRQRLIRNHFFDGDPAWMPLTGTQIEFQSARDGNSEIMRIDGTGQLRLTRSRRFDGEPSWSPDSQWCLPQ
jgi:hypothetical protein